MNCVFLCFPPAETEVFLTHGSCQTEQEILTGLYRDSVTEQLFTSTIKQKSLCLRIILAKGFKRLQVLRLNPGGVFYFNGPKQAFTVSIFGPIVEIIIPN
jgi:hypothetical protein